MAKIEQIEMDAYRAQITTDLRSLVEKYRSIFGWDVPENDEAFSDRLILKALRQTLDDIEAESSAGSSR